MPSRLRGEIGIWTRCSGGHPAAKRLLQHLSLRHTFGLARSDAADATNARATKCSGLSSLTSPEPKLASALAVGTPLSSPCNMLHGEARRSIVASCESAYRDAKRAEPRNLRMFPFFPRFLLSAFCFGLQPSSSLLRCFACREPSRAVVKTDNRCAMVCCPQKPAHVPIFPEFFRFSAFQLFSFSAFQLTYASSP